MNQPMIRKVVITGGGTAGWVAAAALSHQFRDLLEIVLVESDQVGTIGVGESTIPPLRSFHRLLQIDEREFMRAVAGTFKLAISFENWSRPGESYVHPFGNTGLGTWSCDFHHFWLDSLRRGMQTPFADYCLESLAARAGRFNLPMGQLSAQPQWSARWAPAGGQPGEQPGLNYAYQLDAGLYAAFLRRFAEKHGLRRVEGRIQQVLQDPESGNVTALQLESGQQIEGDLFIDCTGFRGLLIEQALQTGYENWNHWLPCDRAVALQVEATGPAVPYTRAIAHQAGWRWQIPLQHRVGTGWVYSSAHQSDDAAVAGLQGAVSGRPIRDPLLLRFPTGRRRLAWHRNVVAIGLSAGFVEPLESTGIHLGITGVIRLIQLFPHHGINPALVQRYNEMTRIEMEHVRDFIILHYHLNQRDEPLWRQCREMAIPDSLAARIEQFRQRAHAWQGEDELFRLDSWTHVMLGQGLQPQQHHPLARGLADADLRRLLQAIHQPLRQAVDQMPSHQAFIDRYCPAGAEVWNQRRLAAPA
ncbi:MAG: tryptophan halogenase family protein [Lysobacterales bacterium]